jgi:predicted kinase
MPEMIMLVGVPGSGKSTWLKDNGYTDRADCMILSTDNYIQDIADKAGKTYSEVFSNTIKDAERNLYRNLDIAVEYEMDIIWDQTNLTQKTRMNKLKHIPWKYRRVAMVFPVPEPEVHNIWLNSKERVGKSIPDDMIHSMIENFEQPSLSEGFTEIRLLKR